MHIPAEQMKAAIGRDIDACAAELAQEHSEAAAAQASISAAVAPGLSLYALRYSKPFVLAPIRFQPPLTSITPGP
jgi:hypothetical protein